MGAARRIGITPTIGVALFVAAAVLLSINVLAADGSYHPVSAKRQLSACMTKRMADNKSLSYNEATKLCKQQLQAQQSTLTATVVAKPLG